MKLQTVRPRSAAAFAVLSLALVGGASAALDAEPTTVSRLTYSDPAGDASTAPDVTTVSVVGDARTGMISFSVTATGVRPASPDGMTRWVSVWLDTDNNPATGDDGSEHALFFVDDPADPEHWWNVGRWNGSDWQQPDLTPGTGFSRAGDVLTWRLHKTQLGGSTRFSIVVSTSIDDAGGNTVADDWAPDNAEWIYDINGPTRTAMWFVRPVLGKPVTVPARVRAGQRVTLSVPVTRAEGAKSVPLTKGTMTCDPSVAGRTIAHAESFKSGVARLSFVVPKTAKGKPLKVKLTIKASSYRGPDGTFIDLANGRHGLVANVYSGTSTTKVFSFTVR
jgi:hypothetical protein